MSDMRVRYFILAALVLVLSACCDHENEEHADEAVGHQSALSIAAHQEELAELGRQELEEQELAAMEAHQVELAKEADGIATPTETPQKISSENSLILMETAAETTAVEPEVAETAGMEMVVDETTAPATPMVTAVVKPDDSPEVANEVSLEAEAVPAQLESIIPEVIDPVAEGTGGGGVIEEVIELPPAAPDASAKIVEQEGDSVAELARYEDAKSKMMGAWMGVLNGMVTWAPGEKSASSVEFDPPPVDGSGRVEEGL